LQLGESVQRFLQGVTCHQKCSGAQKTPNEAPKGKTPESQLSGFRTLKILKVAQLSAWETIWETGNPKADLHLRVRLLKIKAQAAARVGRPASDREYYRAFRKACPEERASTHPPAAIAKELLLSYAIERDNLPASHLFSCLDLP